MNSVWIAFLIFIALTAFNLSMVHRFSHDANWLIRRVRKLRYQRDILHKHFNVFAEKFFLFYPLPKDLIEVLDEIEGKKTKYGKTQDLISEKAKQTAFR
jgi:hypothetical protein